jgi:hypothetical protein
MPTLIMYALNDGRSSTGILAITGVLALVKERLVWRRRSGGGPQA